LPKILSSQELNPQNHFLIGNNVSNNYGELLACKYALLIALQEGVPKIFGDSALIIDYWSHGHIKKENNPQTISLAREVAVLRRQFEANGGQILKISGGANPADLGFHK